MKSEYESLKSKSRLEEQNKIIVEKYLAGWNNKDLNFLVELADRDFAFYSPSVSPSPMNIEQTKAWGESIIKAFPDLRYDSKEILADSDKVIVWWTFSGTHQGEIWNLPPSGRLINNSAIQIFKIKDRKILEVRTEIDGVGLFQQLGMELRPKKQ